MVGDFTPQNDRRRGLDNGSRAYGGGVFLRSIGLGLLVAGLLFSGPAACGLKTTVKGVVFDMDKVIQEFKELTSPASQGQDQPRREEGRRLAEAGDLRAAVEAFKRVVEEEPENFFGFNAIGVCFKNMGDDENALKNFERALEFAESPKDHAKVLSNIGNLYFTRGNLQAALGYYKEASSYSDKNPLYFALIARTFMALGEADRAQRVLAQSDEQGATPDDGDKPEDAATAYYLMALCWAGLGNEAEMMRRLELSLRTDPTRMAVRLGKDLQDERSLLYTMKDEPALKALGAKYSGGRLPREGLSKN
jgi:tetratricopeptide (TPR) repeat protein